MLYDENPPSPRGIGLLTADAACLGIAIVVVVLRMWARRIKKFNLAFNDFAIMAALTFQAAQSAAIACGVLVGKAGYHADNVNADEMAFLRKVILATEPLWVTANTCIKMSILQLYLTLFPIKSFRLSVQAVMILALIYWLGVFLRIFFLCTPFAYSWNKNIRGGACFNHVAAYSSILAINLMLDVAVVVLPMYVVWHIQMPLRKKLMICVIFGFGGIVCVIATLRIISSIHVDQSDFSYTVVQDALYSLIELCLGIINACLPVLRPALNKCCGSRAITWTHNYTNGPSASRSFRHLGDHDYPMTPGTGTFSHVRALDKPLPREPLDDAITVIRSWEIK